MVTDTPPDTPPDTPSDSPSNDAPPRLRLRHLRDHDRRCGLRLFHERAGTRTKGRPSGSHGRFAVASRLVEDARVAHTELRAATRADFPVPGDLFAEQQLLYSVGALAYVTLFADRPARLVDVDRWAGRRDDLGLELVAPIDLVVQTASGELEVRMLRLARREVDDAEWVVTRSRLRTLGWDRLRLVMADLLTLAVIDEDLDLSESADDDDATLLRWAEALDAQALGARPRPGADCRDCPYVAHCPPMRAERSEAHWAADTLQAGPVQAGPAQAGPAQAGPAQAGTEPQP